MNDPFPESIQNLLWRQTLTAEERAQLDAWLARHPEARETLAEDRALTSALGRLPDVPVPTNFTARLLAELDRAERPRPAGSRLVWRWLSGWMPRTAAAALVIGLSVFGWHQHRVTQRTELARSMVENFAVLGPEVLDNFDSIQRLGSVAPDQALLRALE